MIFHIFLSLLYFKLDYFNTISFGFKLHFKYYFINNVLFQLINFPTLKNAIEKEKVEVVKILLDRDELNVNAKSINNEYHSI